MFFQNLNQNKRKSIPFILIDFSTKQRFDENLFTTAMVIYLHYIFLLILFIKRKKNQIVNWSFLCHVHVLSYHLKNWKPVANQLFLTDCASCHCNLYFIHAQSLSPSPYILFFSLVFRTVVYSNASLDNQHKQFEGKK